MRGAITFHREYRLMTGNVRVLLIDEPSMWAVCGIRPFCSRFNSPAVEECLELALVHHEETGKCTELYKAYMRWAECCHNAANSQIQYVNNTFMILPCCEETWNYNADKFLKLRNLLWSTWNDNRSWLDLFSVKKHVDTSIV